MLSFIAERSREEAGALVRPAGETMTYASLAMAAAAVAQAIAERVGEPARRLVALAVGDGAQLVASLLAVLEAGGVALPLDERLGLDRARTQARAARALALVVGDLAEDRVDVEPVDPARPPLPPDAGLVLPPPLVVAPPPPRLFTRAELHEAVDAAVAMMALSPSTRMAWLAPGARPFALVGQALATLRAGGTLLDVARLETTAQLEALQRLDGNTILAVPSQLDRLARAVLDQGAARPSLTRIFALTPSLSAPLAARLAQAFPQAVLVNLHRSADPLRFTTKAPDEQADEQAMEVDGERVDAEAVEAELRARPDVREAAVLLVRDAVVGMRLVAFVAPAPGSDGKPVAPPARVVTLVSLPHAPDGSIDRQALRRMASPE